MAPSHRTAAIENIFLLLVLILIVHIFSHKKNFRTIVQLAWNMPRLYSTCHNIKWMKLIGDPRWGFTLTCISIRKEIDWIVFPSPISSAKMEFCLNSRNKLNNASNKQQQVTEVHKNWVTMDVTRENSQIFATLQQVSLQNEHRNSIMMTCHYPELGSDSDWFKQTSYMAQPIRSATQIGEVIRHQYGISAFHPQTAFWVKSVVTSQNVSCLHVWDHPCNKTYHQNKYYCVTT